MSLVYVTKCVKKLMLILFGLLTLGLVLVFFTNVGFPYSADKENPSTQRLIVQVSYKLKITTFLDNKFPFSILSMQR